MDQQRQQLQPATVKIPVKQFAAKYQSKRENYMFVAGPCNAYIDHYDCVNIYYIKELVTGKKK